MKKGTIDPKRLEYCVSKRILDDVQSQRVCGAAVSVLQHGKTVYEDTFGYQSPESSVPLRKDAVFRIASMTKPITAVAVLQLVQGGALRLEDEVAKYVPQYRHIPMAEGGFNQVPMRIWHLLTHTSGMEGVPSYKEIAHRLSPEDNKSTTAAASFYATLPLPYEPGTYRRYSGRAAFDLLGRIVEVATGVEFAEFLHQNIFVPCGMADTTFAPSPTQWERMVGMHDYQNGCSVVYPTVPGCVVDDCPVTHPLGGGGLVSTMEDYIRFAQMLQNKGLTHNGRILDEEWIDQMAKAQLPVEFMS